ncbi:hypothetical protein CLV56_2881 [Mumia flava]|uniref:Amidohydrolase family protein n=1 Tax=Mumia flava TaxID=1348852 RepID=A0A2M9B636_9ACTN|nr:amidohydrolase [Mumia flava]PJJ53392.1 hypothetical protein CLV56_2881 [Mumia flava]
MTAGLGGARLLGVVDHHVHAQLVDLAGMPEGGVVAVVDLGGRPESLRDLAARARDDDRLPRVHYAGAFLTVPGGYPSTRTWCPPGAARIVRSAADAAEAVAEQVGLGSSCVKLALNADAGPVPEPVVVHAVVEAAHAHDVDVVAHVEGPTTVRSAADAGVDVLAHTPWTERVDDLLVARLASSGQRWISTLDIHRGIPVARARALDNLRRFHAVGGRVLYGTDLGNGDLPVGRNDREVAALHEAGLDDAAVAAALTDPWPARRPATDR